MRSCLLSREAEPSDHFAHAGRMIFGFEALSGDRAEIVERVGRNAVFVGIGASHNDFGKRLFLTGIELARPARLVTIVEAVDAFGIVALDRITKRLSCARPRDEPAPTWPLSAMPTPKEDRSEALSSCPACRAPESMIRWHSMTHTQPAVGIPRVNSLSDRYKVWHQLWSSW